MTLALVVQRYGARIAGGSEALCREYAQRLAGAGHTVTVLTSCAEDYLTWANVLPPGATVEDGVTVRRFAVARERRQGRFRDLSDAVFGLDDAGMAAEEAWFRENGPDLPGLLDHLRTEGQRYDRVLFFTFRYASTYFGLPLVADRAILVPTAEEDPAIRLRSLEAFFRRPAGYLFMTPEEQTLVETSAGRPLSPSAISGIGVEPPPPLPSRAPLDPFGLPDTFALCLGRVDRNKGAHDLAGLFIADQQAGGPDVALVFAGPPTTPLPAHPRIRPLGFVAETVREALLAHARLLVVPSPYESLSIALLEAWNHGVPALVNGRCQVLAGQVARAGGGLAYRSPLEFSEAFRYLLEEGPRARAMGEAGRAYVDREYRWPTVMARVESMLAATAPRP